MSKSEIVPFQQPVTPAVSFGDMTRLAEAVARSGLFGIKTPDQALALMALAQAEGRHPATVARDYHIIGGSPAKKAEAMQRDFLMSGGKIEWLELSDEAVEATFSHPIGGTVTIRWDTARCKQAGLVGGNHQKFPRQMKRSRVVSEGVRTVWPLATSGMYVPEEVAEFASPSSPSSPADTRADLDAFASAKPVETVEPETGEILDAAAIEREARNAAAGGTDHFREYLRGLSREARATLNGKIGTKDAPGELLRMAIEADEIIHRVEQAPDEPPPSPPALDDDAYRIDLPDNPNTDDIYTFESAIVALIESGAPKDAIARNNVDSLKRFGQYEPMRHSNLMKKLEAG